MTTTEGPLLILAGAGSGKTKTLTHRIAYLIDARRVPPEHILGLTFTNKAAREMRDRVARLVGRRRGSPFLGTFHSFCARTLRREGKRVGRHPSFTIYDEEEAQSVMKSVITDASLSPKIVVPSAVLHTIGEWKDDLRTIAEAKDGAHDAWEERVALLWEAYEHRLRELNAIDFDSLLSDTVTLLRAEERVRHHLEEQHPYLSVDEYQDTNHSQSVLLRLLAGQTRNVCAVGDDAQAIYGWRGAKVENIRRFPEEYPGCTVITLAQNYRSTQAILDTANAIIAESRETTPKHLWTENVAGAPPHVLRTVDERAEGRVLLRTMQQLVAAGTYQLSDAAILYRTNAQSRALEEACLRAGVPYEIVGGLTFYERREVKDVVAYLRLIENPRDELAFRRIANVPTRGIGERTVERCLGEARARGVDPLDHQVIALLPDVRREGLRVLGGLLADLRKTAAHRRPSELLDELLRTTNFRAWLREQSRGTTGRPEAGDDRFENVLELKTVAERHETLRTFLEELALMSDAEKTSPTPRDSVKLMTIHMAKGLEFPVVAVAGMEEGLLPHQSALNDPRELEEERRLCYVAVTRAKDHLFLSTTRTRTMYGTSVETLPSRFLDEVPGYTGETDETHWGSDSGEFLDITEAPLRRSQTRHAGTG